MKILHQIFNTIDVSHKDAIKQVMASIRVNAIDRTDREIQFDAQRLVALIKGKKQIFNPILAIPLSVIDSDAHNQNMESTYVDLKTLYSEASHIGNIQSQQKASIESSFNKARASVYKLINDARVFSIRSRNPQYDDIKLINFNIARNEGKILPLAIIDQESRLLKLPEVFKVRNHIEKRDQNTTEATVEILSIGQRGHLSSSFEPILALDGKTETFWGELIYADEPIQTSYTRKAVSGIQSSIELVHGPVVKFKLKFSKSEPVNQIKILPFSFSDVRVLDILYRPSSSSLVTYPIDSFTDESSLDWIEYNFSTIYAQEIEIILTQESYREFIVNIPKHILFSTDFFLRFIEERKRELQEIPVLDDIDIGGNHELYSEAIGDLESILLAKDLTKLPSTEVDLAGKTIMSIGETLAGFSPDLSSLLEDMTSYTDALPAEIASNIESITKYEYLIGAKDIQTNFVGYSPYAKYESPKFETQGITTYAQIEVDERHLYERMLGTNYALTSTEWELEFAPDRKVPIYPKNQIIDGLLPVKSERLQIDPVTRLSLTRFPAYINFSVIRRNNKLLIENIDYEISWNGSTNNGKIQIVLYEVAYKAGAIYTVDYIAAPSSVSVDILQKYKPKKIPVPNSFTETDSDKKLSLVYYPYVNYNIINSTVFTQDDTTKDFIYGEPTGVYGDLKGRVRFQPNWQNASGIIPDSILSGSNVLTLVSDAVYGTGNFSNLSTTYLTDPYRYYLKFGDYYKTYEVASIDSSTQLTLSNVPLFHTGLLGNEIPLAFFTGNMLEDLWPNYTGASTGVITSEYTLHVVYTDGDEIFGFDNLIYRPVDVSVGGTKAKNITDYVNLEQPAFTVSESKDDEYEFIHDGNFIYFNQGISNTEILVDYKKIIDYIKVNCILRANKVINPSVSPQVNEYRLLLNTSIL